jgi:hypothetical protein
MEVTASEIHDIGRPWEFTQEILDGLSIRPDYLRVMAAGTGEELSTPASAPMLVSVDA